MNARGIEGESPHCCAAKQVAGGLEPESPNTRPKKASKY